MNLKYRTLPLTSGLLKLLRCGIGFKPLGAFEEEHNTKMEELWDIAFGPQVAMLVHATVKHSIPKKLAQSPQTVQELCEGAALIPSKLERTLLTLEAFGYYQLDEATNKWSNTPPSEFLIHPQGEFVIVETHPYRLTIGKHLAGVIREENTNAFLLEAGMPFFASPAR